MQPSKPSICLHYSNETASRKPGTLHVALARLSTSRIDRAKRAVDYLVTKIAGKLEKARKIMSAEHFQLVIDKLEIRNLPNLKIG